MPLVNRKQKVAKIRPADIIVIGGRKFIVRRNEIASLVFQHMRCLTVVPLNKREQEFLTTLTVSDTEKFKITRHK